MAATDPPVIRSFRRFRNALLLGLAVGLAGVIASLVPAVLRWEEEVGLEWLFRLRGARTPPADVVVVSVDEASAAVLELPTESIPQWRFQHAALVEKLRSVGAEVIAFDMFFGRPQTEHDPLLAATIRTAGGVILTSQLRRQSHPDGSWCDQLIPPIESLTRSATATAGFTLPVWPLKTAQFWTWKDFVRCDPQRTVSQMVQLPAVIVQAWALPAWGEFLALLREVRPQAAQGFPADSDTLLREGALERAMLGLRQRFRSDPTLGPQLRASLARRAAAPPDARDRARRLQAMINLYAGPDSHYLNFYGSSRSVTTLPYYRVLRDGPPSSPEGIPVDLRGKIVLVGYSAKLQPEQQDGFPTAFSEHGLHLSGVEIGATAVANLIENNPVRVLPLPAHWTGMFLWGALLGMMCLLLPIPLAIGFGMLVGPMYLAYTWYQFNTSNVWLPLMVPLFLQTPLALSGAILARYLQARAQRERIQQAFGYYLPPDVVSRLADDAAHVKDSSQRLFGTCLATDAEQYTRLSESLPPEELRTLMNEYYEALFREVERHGGIVSDVIGDAMLAIWATPRPDSRARAGACQAAVAIATALAPFNRARPGRELPTRFGLHSGPIVLGNIGAGQHYEYRAVGDIVNTANRIQALNKQLGTRALVSAETLAQTDGIAAREVGTFLLPGKTSPLRIHELLVNGEADSPASRDHATRFAAALASFRSERWDEAERLFRAIAEDYPTDTVAHFYARLCGQYRATGGVPLEQGAIRIESK
jgi:adenylate cyclase